MPRRDLIGAWHRPEQAVSAGCPTQSRWRWTRSMIVLGADTHKRSHTIAAVAATSGELLGEQTVRRAQGRRGAAALGAWPGRRAGVGDRGLRHVSGSLERFDRARRTRPACAQHVDVGVAAPGARARQVRQHRRARGRPGGVARRPRHVAGRAPGWARARSAAAGRSPRTAGPPAGGDQQHAAMASARPLARPAVPGQRAVSRQRGGRGSRAGSPGPSRRCASGSPATSCAASAN